MALCEPPNPRSPALARGRVQMETYNGRRLTRDVRRPETRRAVTNMRTIFTAPGPFLFRGNPQWGSIGIHTTRRETSLVGNSFGRCPPLHPYEVAGRKGKPCTKRCAEAAAVCDDARWRTACRRGDAAAALVAHLAARHRERAACDDSRRHEAAHGEAAAQRARLDARRFQGLLRAPARLPPRAGAVLSWRM